MLNNERYRRIVSLALPIIGGMLSQNVLNLVDTAMVGVLGDAALGAVGMGGFLNFLVSAFIMGFSASVQAIAARRVGEGRTAEIALPLNGALVLDLALAIPLSVVMVLLAPSLFNLLVNDPETARLGTPYLQARLCALLGMGANFAFRGFWNATDRSKLYMRTLIVMHATNITLNYLLIFGKFGLPKLGVAGAGIASMIATYVGTAYYLYLAWTRSRDEGFLRALPRRESYFSLLRLTIPTGVQQTFFAAGMVAFYWIVGRIGKAELAAAHVLIQLTLVAILPGIGFGLAAASLVGQALGRSDRDDATRWGWEVSRVAFLAVSLIALPAIFFPKLLLAIFIHNPSTLALAVWPLRVIALGIGLDSIGLVLMNALLGAGDNRRVMLVALGTQWLLFLPLAYLIGPVLGHGLLLLWLAQMGYRLLQMLIFAKLWHGRRWQTISL